jgi:hypothetical protein
MDDFFAYVDCEILDAVSTQKLVDFVLETERSKAVVRGDSVLFLPQILDAIGRSPSIKKLTLMDSKTMGREDAAAVARVLLGMTEFTVQCCVFTDETARLIADGVRASSALASLTISNLTIHESLVPDADAVREADALLFADAVRDSATCDALSLRGMTFCAETAKRFGSNFGGLRLLELHAIKGCEHFVAAIASATRLKSLFLGSGALSAADTLVLCEAMRRLTLLDLSAFKLDVAVLCDALSQKTCALERLSLKHCSRRYVGTEIAEMMKCVGGLVDIELCGVDLRGDAAVNLVRAISESKTMHKIHVFLCSLDDDTGVALAKAAGANGRLKNFDINGDNFGDDAIYALASAVLKSPELECITFRGKRDYSSKAMHVLAAAVEKSDRLQHVSVNTNTPLVILFALVRARENAQSSLRPLL